jgi:hypothetical protein
MCPVMPCLSSSTCQADAILASALQRSDEPSAGQARQAAARAALGLNLQSGNGSHRWRSGAPGITGISAGGRHGLTLRCDGTAAVRVLTPQVGELRG